MSNINEVMEMQEEEVVFSFSKYPKTDYTYSLQSKDRVELAPGQVAMPNMSRRSLQAFRTNGPNTEEDNVDHYALLKSQRWQLQSLRRRLAQGYDSSDDDYIRANSNQYKSGQESWLVTRFFLAIWTRIVSIITTVTETVFGGERERYPYTARHYAHGRDGGGFLRKTGSILAAPLVWSYYAVHRLVTTVTTTTETDSHTQYPPQQQNKSRWCFWLLPLLLLAALFGGYYTYENYEDITLPEYPDFNDYLPDLTSLSKSVQAISSPLPEMPPTFYEYKAIASNRLANMTDYSKVVMESCLEEITRYWKGLVG